MSVETIAEIDNVYEQGAGYKLVGTDTSTLYVPNAPGNRHYELILAWIDEGNTVEEAVYAADLAAAKEKRIAEVKGEAWNLLHPTDWYDIRQQAGGPAVPVNIASYRDAVRDTSNLTETDINALTTIADVRDYDFSWPLVP